MPPDLEYPAVLFRILVIQRSGSMRLVKYAVISGFVTVMALPGLVVANTAADTTGADTTGADTDDSVCLLYTSPSPRDATLSRMPSSA